MEHRGVLMDMSAIVQTRQALLRGVWRCVHAQAVIRRRKGGGLVQVVVPVVVPVVLPVWAAECFTEKSRGEGQQIMAARSGKQSRSIWAS